MRQILHGCLTIVILSTACAGLAGSAGARSVDPHGHHRRGVDVDRLDYRHRQLLHARRAYRARGFAYAHPASGYSEGSDDLSYTGPGAIIFEATRRAAKEPGVTNELAPDAKETATGGPSGGVPGFSGR